MSKFKIGDRVKYVGTDSDYKGKVGTIVIIDDGSIPYGVKFDREVYGGHDLKGKFFDGYGRWLRLEEIELIDSTSEELEKEVNSLEQFTDEQLKTELDKRERAKVIKELREYIDKPVHYHKIPEYTNRFELILDDEGFQNYCDTKTTEELKEELKNRKENKINEILEILNNNIKELRKLGYTIPYQDNTIIDSLEFNKVFNIIGVFYEYE